jgi:hypothetical protein
LRGVLGRCWSCPCKAECSQVIDKGLHAVSIEVSGVLV